ncbi:hypothetical protein WR25_19840 [Diploscapter pachys]|uniref:ShKT domain-containing protein n=1 Tax=Diploscapter pachys TaxID=2018661 RepID=A0A2A2KMN0_9BILA|nr:hypothetical protein WR25_19840 [Diploscapter pachys]
MMYLLFIFSLITIAYSQTCSNESPGSCIMGNCPGEFTCIEDGSPNGICCANADIVTTTTTPSTTTTTPSTSTTTPSTSTTTRSTSTTKVAGQSTTPASGTCVDKLNPKTGVSGRCGVSTTTTASSTCVDKLNPNTGVSGRCGVSATTTASITCVDKLNPKTGVSDCPRMASYCNNAAYYDLMTDQCPKTCGRCGVSATATASSTCVDKLNPNTGVSDCPRMASYCNNAAYYNVMTDQNNENRIFRNYRMRTFRDKRNKWSDQVLTVRFAISVVENPQGQKISSKFEGYPCPLPSSARQHSVSGRVDEQLQRSQHTLHFHSGLDSAPLTPAAVSGSSTSKQQG